MSIPNTYSKLPPDKIKAREINHCLRIGAHATVVMFEFTATSSIVATAKFNRTYKIAQFYVNSSSSTLLGFRKVPVRRGASGIGVSVVLVGGLLREGLSFLKAG